MSELNEEQKLTLILRSKLRERCAAARQDAMTFAVLTILLTPVAIGALIFFLIFAFALVDRGWVVHLFYTQSFLGGANLYLAFMGASYFLRPDVQYSIEADDKSWAFAGVAIFCGMLALSYLTHLPVTHTTLFWSLYPILATGMLGCFGKAYVPCDNYYLGWTAGPFLLDNPFTFRDDIDRAHLGLGFASSTACLILESYGEVFGSGWLYQELSESQLNDAAHLLRMLASQDVPGITEHIQDPRSLARISRALAKLEFVSFAHCRLSLTVKGRDFIRESRRW